MCHTDAILCCDTLANPGQIVIGQLIATPGIKKQWLVARLCHHRRPVCGVRCLRLECVARVDCQQQDACQQPQSMMPTCA